MDKLEQTSLRSTSKPDTKALHAQRPMSDLKANEPPVDVLEPYDCAQTALLAAQVTLLRGHIALLAGRDIAADTIRPQRTPGSALPASSDHVTPAALPRHGAGLSAAAVGRALEGLSVCQEPASPSVTQAVDVGMVRRERAALLLDQGHHAAAWATISSTMSRVCSESEDANPADFPVFCAVARAHAKDLSDHTDLTAACAVSQKLADFAESVYGLLGLSEPTQRLSAHQAIVENIEYHQQWLGGDEHTSTDLFSQANDAVDSIDFVLRDLDDGSAAKADALVYKAKLAVFADKSVAYEQALDELMTQPEHRGRMAALEALPAISQMHDATDRTLRATLREGERWLRRPTDDKGQPLKPTAPQMRRANRAVNRAHKKHRFEITALIQRAAMLSQHGAFKHAKSDLLAAEKLFQGAEPNPKLRMQIAGVKRTIESTLQNAPWRTRLKMHLWDWTIRHPNRYLAAKVAAIVLCVSGLVATFVFTRGAFTSAVAITTVLQIARILAIKLAEACGMNSGELLQEDYVTKLLAKIDPERLASWLIEQLIQAFDQEPSPA